jgi:hypothetical protein
MMVASKIGPIMTDFTLIKADKLTKPATVLIEKISEAVGGIFKPYQIVRVAKAEVEADRIHASSQIQITDLHRRAMHRFLEEEANKQLNIESITQQALPLLEEKSAPQNIENDWIINFFDKCRIVSDTTMQLLWSRILAGEANNPGGFSRRTVNLVSDLEKSDAELFANLCCFGWTHENLSILLYPLVFDVSDEIYNQRDIYFSNLVQLETLGLVQFDNSGGFVLRKQQKQLTVSYFGSKVQLIFPNDVDNHFDLGTTLLTKAGRELASVCAPQPIEGFLEYVVKHWEEKNLTPKICETTERTSET